MTTQITIPAPPEPSISPYQARRPKAPDIVNDDFFGSFADLIDVINPLQHIPIVSTLYRELSGDNISDGARIAGGTIFGGPIGLIASIIDSIMTEATGKDVGGHLYAQATGKYETAGKLS